MVGIEAEGVVILGVREGRVESVGVGGQIDELPGGKLNFRHLNLAFLLALKCPAGQIDGRFAVVFEFQIFLLAESVVQVVVVYFRNSYGLRRSADGQIAEDGVLGSGLGRELVVEAHGVGIAGGQVFREVRPDVAAGGVAAASAGRHHMQTALSVHTVRVVPITAGVVAPGRPVVDVAVEIAVGHVVLVAGVAHLKIVDQDLPRRVHVDVHLGGVASVVRDAGLLPLGRGLHRYGVRFVGKPGGHGGGGNDLLFRGHGPVVEGAVFPDNKAVAQRAAALGRNGQLVESALRVEGHKLGMDLGIVHAVVQGHFLNVVSQDREGEIDGLVAVGINGNVGSHGNGRHLAGGGVGLAGRAVEFRDAPAFRQRPVAGGIQKFQ